MKEGEGKVRKKGEGDKGRVKKGRVKGGRVKGGRVKGGRVKEDSVKKRKKYIELFPWSKHYFS